MREENPSGISNLWLLAYVVGTAVAVVLLLNPSARLGGWFAERRAKAELRERIDTSWVALTQDAGRIGALTHDARVVLEFIDYECPACRGTHQSVRGLLARHPDLAVVYRHMPLPQHPKASDAARASVCSQQIGRFSEMHEYLLTEDGWRSNADWATIAERVGVPPSFAFVDCMAAPHTKERLDRDVALGMRLNVTGTPTFVGPGGMHFGGLDDGSLTQLLPLR